MLKEDIQQEYRLLRRSLAAPVALFISILAGTLIAAAGCSREGGRGEAHFGREAVPVTVAAVVQKTVATQLRAIGTVQPYSTVSVKARVGGELTAVHFREGQEVKAGDLLFTIDPRPFEADLKRAEADLARDIAKAKQAEDEERRWTYMARQGIGSQERADQAHADAEALRAATRADEAAVQTARLNLGYAAIRSPIDGRTGDLILHAGNLVKANDDNPMVVINQLRPVYVDFSLPEKNLAEVKKHMAASALAVEVAVPGQQATVEGKLSFVDNTVDRTTGTIHFKGLFENKDERLWPGQFVDVTLTLAQRPDTILVPSEAIQTGQEGQFVYVVGPHLTAEPRHVVVGDSLDGKTVIERGLKKGETVVTDGQLRLVPGARVRIKKSLDGSRDIAS